MINFIKLTDVGGNPVYVPIGGGFCMSTPCGINTTTTLSGNNFCYTVLESPEQIDRMLSDAQADLAILGQCSKKEIDAALTLVNIKKALDEAIG